MAKKKFKKIEAIATEVSLCSKYNSGANKQTAFEIIKSENQDGFTKEDFSEFVKTGLTHFKKVYGEAMEVPYYNGMEDPRMAFLAFLDNNVENNINYTLYSLLTDALYEGLYNIKYREDVSKEEKAVMYVDLFIEFVNQYKSSPITKNKNGEFVLDTNKSSHSKDEVNPQKVEEIGDKMEEKQIGILKNVVESLKSLISPTQKAEEPAEESKEVEVIEEPKAEEPAQDEPAEEPKAEVEEAGEEEPKDDIEKEAEPKEEEPAEEPAEEKAEDVKEEVEEAPAEEAPAEEPAQEEAPEEEPAEETEIEKSSTVMTELEKAQAKIEELEKAHKESLEIIEKSKFTEMAKSEFSMLVGTAEEIGDRLYAISKSNLPSEVQEFVLENLKKVSKQNSELVVEKGTSVSDVELSAEELEEKEVYKKAEIIAKEKGISINKALRQV